MPKAKRAPIDYTPQFGAGIFRAKETIEQELAELADEAATDAGDTANEAVPEDGVEVKAGHIEGTDGEAPGRRPQSHRTNGAANERANVRTLERSRVRHSFDIWQDQLLGLSEIQADRFSRTGRKPKLGELVQEALDAYITKERKRTNVRTNER
jgi:hypothetical protein